MRFVDQEELCNMPEGTIFCFPVQSQFLLHRLGEVSRNAEGKAIGFYLVHLHPMVQDTPVPVIDECEYFHELKQRTDKYILMLEDSDVFLLITLLSLKSTSNRDKSA